jgi:hypothetical protein
LPQVDGNLLKVISIIFILEFQNTSVILIVGVDPSVGFDDGVVSLSIGIHSFNRGETQIKMRMIEEIIIETESINLLFF